MAEPPTHMRRVTLFRSTMRCGRAQWPRTAGETVRSRDEFSELP